MAITITQSPTLPFDMAYGVNPITLSGIIPAQDKYALRIYIVGQTQPIADIRQTPNRFARAIFDTQNILQSYVGPSKYNIDALGTSGTPLHAAFGELIEYQIAYNTETNGNVDGPWTTSPTVYTVIAGSKQYNQVQFPTGPYVTDIAGDDGNPSCTILNPAAKDPQGAPLSDNQWFIQQTQTGDQFTQDWNSPGGINVHNVYADDQCTKTFYQKINRTAGVPADDMAQGIEAFIVAQYDATGNMVSEVQINNIQANGGGPNVTPGQGLLISGIFQTITMATGPANMPITINPLTTHYYIIPMVFSPTGGACGGSGLMIDAGWIVQRYNILEEPCNDYPHIQFAWLNSLGFRDQFTFTKRNEKGINTTRNEYLKESANYNSTEYSTDLQSRGFTTYSQTIKETWTASTDYINDQEAETLESMFKSAQVMVRFSSGEYANEWVPIQLKSTSYTQKTYRKDRLFQYTVNFNIAQNIKSQRG